MTVTAEGFSRPRLNDIKAEIDADMADALGPVNVNPDAVVGQLDGIWAEGSDNLYETLQNTYDSMYVFSAEGAALDGAVAFVGLERLDATETIVTAAAYGTEGTLIPSGSLSHIDISYSSTSDVVISRANALDVEIEVNTVSNVTAYNLLAGGLSFTYTSDADATSEEILAGLAALINFDPFYAAIENSKLRIYTLDKITPFAITVDSKLTISKRGSPVVFVASEKGQFEAPVGSLTSIDTPVIGWDSLYNLAAGVTGREVETDTELRLRHASSVRATGSATVEAIRARMLADVDGVTSIQIYENRTAITSDDGIPPHAFESVIVGGVNSEIADQLWLTKPAGIETHGNVTVNVLDSTGDLQTVAFSRATTKYGWLNISVDSLDTEEVLPITAELAIKQAAVDYANASIGVGDDVIIQRFYGPIYAAVDGIASMTITADITDAPGDTPSYSAANISIAKAEIAVFDITRVNVSGL